MNLPDRFLLSTTRARSGRCLLAVLASALLIGVSPSVLAARKAKEPQDSAPILMSKTGGGNSWADMEELQAAAKQGNPNAEAQLGEMLLRGEGIEQDQERGVAMIEKAARAGQSAAAFRIGMLLANGDGGVAKDPVRALDYFRAAAAGGEAEAFFNIGAAYASARGVKRDYAEALAWLILAREHGADPRTEQAMREQFKSQASLIAKGERRAKEIASEMKDKKVTDLLPPPAPLDESVAALPSSR